MKWKKFWNEIPKPLLIFGICLFPIMGLIVAATVESRQEEELYQRRLAEMKKHPAVLEEFKNCVATQGPRLRGRITSDNPFHFCATLIFETMGK